MKKRKCLASILFAFATIAMVGCGGCSKGLDEASGSSGKDTDLFNVVSEESTTTELESKELDIYLIGGQSNAAGSTEHKYALNGEFKNVGYAGQVNKSYLSGSAWVDNISSFKRYKWKVTVGHGEMATRMGPEYGMAEILNDYYNGEKKAFIFKSAAGATTLASPYGGDFGTWLPRSRWEKGYDPATTTTGIGYQYYTFVENFAKVYQTLKENGYTPKIKGMVWMQGENDLEVYQQYGNLLSAFISDIRADLYKITGDEDVKTMPFVIGKVATTFQSYENPLVPRFNHVQQVVADNTENCETIETADLIIVDADGSIKGSDMYHFNYNDMRTLGNRFAQKLLEMNGMSHS